MKCAIERRKKIEGTHIQHILRVESVYVKPTSTKKNLLKLLSASTLSSLTLLLCVYFNVTYHFVYPKQKG